MLLGSLYWEGEQDGERGNRRQKWRSTRLDMRTCRDLPGVPIRYGRRSQSRNGEFTIVFGGKPAGVAKMANLRAEVPLENGKLGSQAIEILRKEVRALGEAERIWTERNPKHITTWGLVAIAVNPKSKFNDQLCTLWQTHFSPGPGFHPSHFGKGIIDQNAILQIGLPDEVWKGLSFCLCTPTKPEPKDQVPTAADIAKAVVLGSYFRRTYESGIKTADDAEIWHHLRQA